MIIVIIIIVIIAVVAYFLYTKPAKTDSFQLLKSVDKQEVYINSVNIMLDKNIKTITRNIVVKNQDELILRNNVFNKCMALYPLNTDKMGSVLVDEIIRELRNMKYKIEPELEEEMRKDVHYASKYLNYMDNRFKLPGEFIEPTSLSLKRPGQSRLPAHEVNIGNMINDEINKEHSGIIPKKNYFMGMNNLTSGIDRSGFANAITGSMTADIRGRPEGLLRRLSAMSSSKDPNSLARYAGGDVGDVLINSKGLANETVYENALDAYYTRTRDPEYRTMKNITGRLVPPEINRDQQANLNIVNNIKSDILRSL